MVHILDNQELIRTAHQINMVRRHSRPDNIHQLKVNFLRQIERCIRRTEALRLTRKLKIGERQKVQVV